MTNLKRLTKEFQDISRNPPAGVSAEPISGDMFHWAGTITGPENTPYSGGNFKLDITFPPEYPHKAPVVKFVTKIYHPNIDDAGLACIDILRDKWAPSIKIDRVLQECRTLLAQPHPDSPSNAIAGQEFVTEKAKYEQKARQMTQQYAK